MNRKTFAMALMVTFLFALAGAHTAAVAAEPDYSEWNRLLSKYYNPSQGMDYAHLKASDGAALHALGQKLAKTDVASLTPKQQLAYWINLYNVNVVTTVVDHYPVASIRDISTDPIVRLNVFKKDTVPFGNGKISLNTIENDKIRNGFKDPRIHFAINCAAKSCPPMRTEAFTGAKVDQQLDDQVQKFAAGSGIRVEAKDGKAVVHVTKVMDWFGDDFDKWGGGKLPFLKKYLPQEKLQVLKQYPTATIDYDGYDWKINDWKR